MKIKETPSDTHAAVARYIYIFNIGKQHFYHYLLKVMKTCIILILTLDLLIHVYYYMEKDETRISNSEFVRL